MALKNRKIRTRQRGTRSCGRGRKGTRWRYKGRGLAGGHKHLFSWFTTNDPDHFGADSMTGRPKPKTVNVGYLNDLAVASSKHEIDAISLGFEKVIGGGKVTKPLTVKAKAFTAGAKQKIEAAGGKALTE